ncbi:MAG: hypothetical protein IGR80_18070 [Synechococcales cyanobacterium K44_A2020_017]|nr:hypothetical protein [Synechococcales cyanobacterium K44_A2020_017]
MAFSLPLPSDWDGGRNIDITQTSTEAAQQESGVRWTIEAFHRELKQLTGVEACQCRKARIQRNPIACALLVWTRLKTMAY